MKALANGFKTYKHGLLIVIYMIFYLFCFFILENQQIKGRTIIHMEIDDYVPFVEVFVIPYYMWFGFVALAIVLLIFQNKKEYYKACVFLITGMTLFLLVSALLPNGLQLRPLVMPRDNFFTRMLQGLYQVDTSTNVWPSIHVYNSIGAYIAITKSRWGRNPIFKMASLGLCISIIASTMLIKQHSVFDVITALCLAGVMYAIVYRPEAIFRKSRRPQPEI
ncbi:MAG: serine/threonine protein phosphatase [Lachnospiraceae bacterium]|jgi:membrane-associated phospholipid phosphatase|nr:serine/threonine protein phosphatase [Lachnospiraceae bacterium]